MSTRHFCDISGDEVDGLNFATQPTSRLWWTVNAHGLRYPLHVVMRLEKYGTWHLPEHLCFNCLQRAIAEGL